MMGESSYLNIIWLKDLNIKIYKLIIRSLYKLCKAIDILQCL